MRKLVLLIAILSSFVTRAQEPFFAISHTTTHGYDIVQSYQNINPNNEQIAIFYMDFEYMYAVGFDSEMVALGRLQNPFSVRKYQRPLLRTSFGDSHVIVVSNNSMKKIAYAAFDFNKRMVNSNEIDLDLRDEEYLSSFDINGSPYIMTLHEKLPQLSLHLLNTDYTITTTTFDLSPLEFLDYKDKAVKPRYIINKDYKGFTGINLSPALQFPNTLGQVMSKNKMYLKDDKILIALDHNNTYTQLLSLDPATGSIELQNIPKPLSENAGQKVKLSQRVKHSNSYYNNGELTQIVITDEQVILSLTDLNSNQVLHTLNVSREEGSEFLNEGFTQFDNQSFKNKSITAKKFFNKIKMLEGISVLTEYSDEGRLFRFGTWRSGQSGGGGSIGVAIYVPIQGGFVGGLVAGMVGATLASLMSPDLQSYSSLVNGRTFQAISAWDSDFKYRPSVTDDNSFYARINEIRQEFPKGGLSLLFKYQDDLILGFYYRKGNYLDMVRY